ncbi:MAG: CBS domain-containing protein [Spirochaetes bacterium]|nr:CBS domain-containing protein [Spirochaetota bacterium]
MYRSLPYDSINYVARKLIDGNETGGKKESGDERRSLAAKAYGEAVKINREREPILHAYTIMKSPVLTVGPGIDMHEALDLFRKEGVSHMPVLSEDKKIIGIVSDRDLLKRMVIAGDVSGKPAAVTVGEIMTKKVITADRLTDLRRIAKAMFEQHIGSMPIVDEKGGLLGIITRSDILYALIHYPPLSLWA